MNSGDYTGYASAGGYHGSQSPEPQVNNAYVNTVRPSMRRAYGGNYADMNGSLRSTRSNAAAHQTNYTRPEHTTATTTTTRAAPQGSLRRAYLGSYDDGSGNYSAPQHLQPYVPDASERRTPDYANSPSQPLADPYSRRAVVPEPRVVAAPTSLPPAVVTSMYSSQEYNGRRPEEPIRYGRRGSNTSSPSAGISGSRMFSVEARKSPGPQRIFPAQRVEFGYTAPVRAQAARSPSPLLSGERDEIADIIADMSKPRVSPGLTGSVFLQLGDETKKAKLSGERLTMTALVNLFIEKYQRQLAEEPETLPSVYIKDSASGVFYELEDMQDVVDGSVLCWHAKPLNSADSADAKPEVKSDVVDSTKHIDEQQNNVVREQLESLAGVVKSLSETVDRLPAQLREELGSVAVDVKKHTDDAVESVRAQLAQQADAQRAATQLQPQPPMSAMSSATLEMLSTNDNQPVAISRSHSLPEVAHAPELEDLREKLRQAELTLSIERQSRREAEELMQKEHKVVEQELAKLRGDVSRHPNILRVRIEEGKVRLKTEYRTLNTQFEDLHSLVQEMRKDVAQRGSIPSVPVMKRANSELKTVETGTQALMRFINETRSDWKRTWEEELQNILKEQSFVKDVEQMLGELLDDTKHLEDVLEKLDKIIDLKLQERSKEDYVPAAATKFIDVISPEEARDAKKEFLMQISCVDIDHEKRLEALKSAEKLRQKELLAAKVNEFEEELGEFVSQRKLRKTGGTEELERRREEKNIEVMKDMLKSVEEAEQARRAKIAQRKAGKKPTASASAAAKAKSSTAE
ncbi:Bud site selection protein 6 [Coemansia sp. Benny D115]|nr:Bud site selection protein 6 [Coemansia sp. Benny D115]